MTRNKILINNYWEEYNMNYVLDSTGVSKDEIKNLFTSNQVLWLDVDIPVTDLYPRVYSYWTDSDYADFPTQKKTLLNKEEAEKEFGDLNQYFDEKAAPDVLRKQAANTGIPSILKGILNQNASKFRKEGEWTNERGLPEEKANLLGLEQKKEVLGYLFAVSDDEIRVVPSNNPTEDHSYNFKIKFGVLKYKEEYTRTFDDELEKIPREDTPYMRGYTDRFTREAVAIPEDHALRLAKIIKTFLLKWMQPISLEGRPSLDGDREIHPDVYVLKNLGTHDDPVYGNTEYVLMFAGYLDKEHTEVIEGPAPIEQDSIFRVIPYIKDAKDYYDRDFVYLTAEEAKRLNMDTAEA